MLFLFDFHMFYLNFPHLPSVYVLEIVGLRRPGKRLELVVYSNRGWILVSDSCGAYC